MSKSDAFTRKGDTKRMNARRAAYLKQTSRYDFQHINYNVNMAVAVKGNDDFEDFIYLSRREHDPFVGIKEYENVERVSRDDLLTAAQYQEFAAIENMTILNTTSSIDETLLQLAHSNELDLDAAYNPPSSINPNDLSKFPSIIFRSETPSSDRKTASARPVSTRTRKKVNQASVPPYTGRYPKSNC